MKATVALALLLLTFVAHADVVFEDSKPSRPPQKKPVKTHTTVTATTTTAATTAGTTSTATVPTTTATTASSVTETTASPTPVVPAPAPERRRSTFPFAAITTVGIVLIVAVTANRRRARKAE
jgi:hypothetical protein